MGMGEVRGGASTGEHGLLKQLHGVAEGNGRPAPKLGFDKRLTTEMQPTPIANHHARTLSFTCNPCRQQSKSVAQRRAEHHRRIHTFVAEAAVIPFDLFAPSDEGGIDQRIEDAASDVADHGLNIVEGDFGLPSGIEGEFFDLRQARSTITAQAHRQDVALLAGDPLAILLKRAVDKLRQGPLVIGVAGQGERPCGSLAECPQWCALCEVSRLYDDASAGDLCLQCRVHGRGVIAASRPYPDATLTAEQADGAGLVHEATCIRGEGIAVDLDQRKRIGGIGDEALGQTLGALEDQAGIRSVDENHRDLRRGSASQQRLDIASLYGGQGLVTSTDATRVLIWSAKVFASRISASRAARSEAKRWIERS